MPSKLRFIIAAAALALVLAAGAASAGVDSYDATDYELVDEFLRLLKAKDIAGLDRFLSPQFYVQRADGTFVLKEDYLKNPVVVDDYVISDVFGTGAENFRVVRYNLSSVEWIDGVELTRDPVVRISIFHWNGERWQLFTHINFVNVNTLR